MARRKAEEPAHARRARCREIQRALEHFREAMIAGMTQAMFREARITSLGVWGESPVKRPRRRRDRKPKPLPTHRRAIEF